MGVLVGARLSRNTLRMLIGVIERERPGFVVGRARPAEPRRAGAPDRRRGPRLSRGAGRASPKPAARRTGRADRRARPGGGTSGGSAHAANVKLACETVGAGRFPLEGRRGGRADNAACCAPAPDRHPPPPARPPRIRRRPAGARVLGGLVASMAFSAAQAGDHPRTAASRRRPPVVATWMMIKDWPDFFPSRRDTYSWRVGLHRRDSRAAATVRVPATP